jgi:Tfp pilus assembly protein PilN
MGWITTHPWAYPALEALHILGIGLLLGSLVVLELRVWGAAQALALRPLAGLALRVTLLGFVLAAATGSVMLASQWDELQGNRALLAKMLLLGVAGVNALAFHLRGGLDKVDRMARVQTALSLGIWVLVIACGRFIAYA